MTINERIGLILKEKNLTANDFAAKLEVRSSNISHIITGRNKPSFDFLEKLLSVFPDINSLWLIMGEGDMNNSEKVVEESVIPKEETKPEAAVSGFSIPMQTNLFGEPEELERPISKMKKIIPTPKGHSPDSEERSIVKSEGTKKISSIIVYYSNGNFEEFIPKQ